MKKAVLLIAGLGIIISLTQLSCKKDDDDPVTPVTMTLYDSLGGTAMVQDPSNTSQMIEKGRLGIRSVVDSTIFVIAADPQLNGFFPVLLAEVGANNMSGFTALSKNLTDFFCVATGAKNFSYGGLNMKDAHNPAKNPRMNGMATNANFDRFVADLVTGAKKCGLSDQLIGQVGAVVETTRGDVVQK